MKQVNKLGNKSPSLNNKNVNPLWCQPKITKIDIKRTLNGVTGTNDKGSPSGDTP